MLLVDIHSITTLVSSAGDACQFASSMNLFVYITITVGGPFEAFLTLSTSHASIDPSIQA